MDDIDRRRRQDVEFGRLQQQVADHEQELLTLLPLRTQVEQLAYRMAQVEQSMKDLVHVGRELKQSMDEFHKARSKNNTLIKAALIGLFGTLATGAITVVVTIIQAASS